MKDDVALLATITLLGVLLQAYFSLQVISARRAFHVSPPLTSGPPEFERVFRAQSCSPVRTVLPVRAPPLLPGIRALGAAQVTRAGLPGKHGREGSLLDAALRVGGGDRLQGTGGKFAFRDRRWADLARGSRSSPVGRA
ncbi:Leukotriene C4 synthase [Lemmus lemmus]